MFFNREVLEEAIFQKCSLKKYYKKRLHYQVKKYRR